MNRIVRLLLLAFAYIAYIGLSAAQTNPTPSNQQPSPEELRLLDEWRISMAQVLLPKKGCFQSEYPSKEWHEVACIGPPPPDRPFMWKRSPRPLNAGDGNDISAKVPMAGDLISSAFGSFESTTNVASEMGQVGGTGPQYADAYSLQLNTNAFPTTAEDFCDPFQGPNLGQLCSTEQFIYVNDGAAPGASYHAFIQYWMFNAPCLPGWKQYGNGCYRNSSMRAHVPGNQPASNLGQYMLSGTVTSTSDQVTFSVGGTMYGAPGDNLVDAAAGWTFAEFNVVGDGGGGQANFNTGAEVDVRNRIVYGGSGPPNCAAGGFTGETNNLNFPVSPPAPSMPGPAVLFDTNTAFPLGTASCASATTIGDTHLYTALGLAYDFQASGDFVVAQGDPDFVVEARQVSGAPMWPNAAVNHDIAAGMGPDTVAVCGPNEFGGSQLYVNGQPIDLGDGQVYSTPNGVDIWRVGNAYNATDQSGNSVNVVNNDDYYATTWKNVTIGLGQWPANFSGLVANANDDVNQIASSGGDVLTTPFTLGDLYYFYGQSWRVGLDGEDLLSVCGQQTEIGNPFIPFYAIQLPPYLYQQARAVCIAAGVVGETLLDDCTLDVAVIGNDAAAQAFVNARQPVAVGNIFIGPNVIGRTQ
jgi:hypothetical protein